MKKIIITGGSGFIGSNFIKKIVKNNYEIINIDNLTYASNYDYIKEYEKNKNYNFIKVDINNYSKLSNIIFKFLPDYIINFAAESHVDNSIKDSKNFIKTNIFGVYNLLRCSHEYLLLNNFKKKFKFIQISTDEVFGSLGKNVKPKIENSILIPSSPYSASKASGDLLVNAWNHTYNLPTIITHCTNNYGPNQHKEKLIPTIINNALNNKPIPIYGSGKQMRDWIYVDDHCDALMKVMKFGKIGQKYNIGSNFTTTNLNLAKIICNKIDILINKNNSFNNKKINLIKHVLDRPGHDFRYALNTNKIYKELNWKSKTDINSGLDKTIKWYIEG